jgi:hypothetical protein
MSVITLVVAFGLLYAAIAWWRLTVSRIVRWEDWRDGR